MYLFFAHVSYFLFTVERFAMMIFVRINWGVITGNAAIKIKEGYSYEWTDEEI